MPSQRPQKGRQGIRGIAGEVAWAGADEDFGRALAFTPAAFTWLRQKANLVELPALWVRVPLRGRDPTSLADDVDAALAGEGCPPPHFIVAGDDDVVAVWRIKSLLRPAPSKPSTWHAAFNGALEAWRRASVKLSLVLAPLGCRPLDVALVDDHLTSFIPLPLESSSPLHAVIGLHDDAGVLLRATNDTTPIVIADVSRALKRFDPPMFKALGIEAKRGKRRWLSSPTSLAAAMPKKPGDRHPAAVEIACAARWDGESERQIEGRLRTWAATCTQDGQFPDRRPGADELTDIVAWVMKKLEPGGPTVDRAGKKVRRRTTVDAVAEGITAFLASVGGTLDAPKHALAKQVALWRAERREPAACPLKTFKRSVAALKAAGGLEHEVVREGRTWRSTWRLPAIPKTACGDETSSRGQGEVSSWSRPRPPSRLPHSGGAAGGLLPPAGGGPGGAESDPTDLDTPATTDSTNHEPARAPKPETGRPRQRRLQLVKSKRSRRKGTEGKDLPPITDELVAALADVAPNLSTAERRELLARARERLRPRPSVLANFQQHLRKRALKLRRRELMAALDAASTAPRSPAAPLAPTSTTPAPEVSEFRRLLSLVVTPLHLRPVHERARRLHEEGLSLVPLLPKSKRPAVDEWGDSQHRPMSITLLRRHLERIGDGAGLAIVCGRVSDVVVADLDDADAVVWAHKHLPATPWRTKTRRGEHWYFRISSTWTTPESVPWTGSVQGEGRYVVAPGSIHPDTGEVYEALGDWSKSRLTLPVLEPRHLVDVDALRAERARILRETE
jgi:hypothetical protein